MIVSFSVNYRTNWGENVWLSIASSDGTSLAYKMEYDGDQKWTRKLEFTASVKEIEYQYELRLGDSVVSRGWGSNRKLSLEGSYKKYVLRDSWQEIPSNKTLFSSPFTQTFFRRSDAALQRTKNLRQGLTIKIFAPSVQPNQRLYISGGPISLGEWRIENAIPMDGSAFPEWSVTVDAETINQGDHYKFVIIENGVATQWEQGQNRIWEFGPIENGEHRVVSGLHFRGGDLHWRAAGVAIPVFSLRSERSAGIGDFSDLKLFADWAAATDQRVIQILPINDTTQSETWHDSYPYKAISIFALHPLYLSMEDMGQLKDSAQWDEIMVEAHRLNALPEMDYEAVGEMKWRFFRALYKQSARATMGTKAYRDFFEANREWLRPYAVFCYLRHLKGTADFSRWGKYSKYSTKLINTLCDIESDSYDAVAIYMFLQFHLDKQLRAAVEYAHTRGVVLKGDIPIGISRDSADAWTDPDLFNMNSQAGAPPDDFSANGQNWGFPTYNWDAMALDGYAWWRRRFKHMVSYFDLYRIDHILGFFRIWEIPLDSVQGLLGHFNPAMPFSREELSYRGLEMQDDRFLKPFIHYDFLGDFFGEYMTDALAYLDDQGWGRYSLKPEFATQRQVQAHFHGKQDPRSIALLQGLYGLINEVLFIADPKQANHFHPRISAQFTKSYQWLNDYEKQRFNELYVDFFYRRHNEFWGHLAMDKLPPLIDATSMLCCAEDLGMIPDCVARVLSDLQIITLEIQRMPKDPNLTFGLTGNFPYLSVCTTSTHDMAPIRLWWEENPEKTQRYFNEILWRYGAAPAEATTEICQAIIGNHLMSPSILTILPLQDWTSIADDLRIEDPTAQRINVPSNPDHYWRYRMPMTIEKLIESTDFNDLIKSMIQGSGRN